VTHSSKIVSGTVWCLTLFIAITGCSSQNREATDATSELSSVLGVDEAMRNLGADTTVVAVEGVVQSVTSEEHLLTLIDVKEYQACGLSDCCLYMPVRWTGTMPAIEDAVVVKGSIQTSDSGLVFVARELSQSAKPETQAP
jgi:hypothetical protein